MDNYQQETPEDATDSSSNGLSLSSMSDLNKEMSEILPDIMFDIYTDENEKVDVSWS